MERKIINKESFSEGKREGHNDDAIYIGENFAAVIDGVSHKSSVLVNGEEVKVAGIIVSALKKLDSKEAPEYAKTLNFEECLRFINMYIKKYLEKNGLAENVGKMEATGVIYSKYHNQLWLVGDCKAMYDGTIAQNPLRIDEVYVAIRKRLIETLLQEGYTQEELLAHDLSKDIIKNPDLLDSYIKSEREVAEIEEYWNEQIKNALKKSGFSEEEIESQELVKKFHNPRDLQKDLKNNPHRKSFGYAVFNGEYTEPQNCKVVDLPDDVKIIKMCSDGFYISAVNSDIAQDVIEKRKIAENDRLSICENQATHSAVQYSKKEGRKPRFAIDDASAVIIEIEHIREDEEKDR